MRFASLGSGSEGNGLVVQAGSTCIMVDCGFPVRETATRLARLGLQPSDINAIVVTHEHADHAGGVPAFAAKHGIAVWATFGTLCASVGRFDVCPRVYGFDTQDCFAVRDLEITPFPVPHDAREPVQFVVGDGDRRLGVLTDIGMSTPHVEASLSGCDALVLEANHDPALLADSDYPWSLKQRIASRFGHLANDESAALLKRLDTTGLKHIVAAHLSTSNNTPRHARNALAGALGCKQEWIGIADQAAGFDWRDC